MLNLHLIKKEIVPRLLGYIVTLHGLAILAISLLNELIERSNHGTSIRLFHEAISIPIIFGLTLLYLSIYIRRRKRTALVMALIIYSLLLTVSIIRPVLLHISSAWGNPWYLLGSILLPISILCGLAFYSDTFTVRSDLRSFTISLRLMALLLLVTFVYGIVGFMVLDKHDFHREISLWDAVQHTVDQFGLTTDDLTAYTHRARIFMNSLSIISIVSLGYGLMSLFQPLRARFSDQTTRRAIVEELLLRYPADSEDFFKLWPHDKMYILTDNERAGIAYAVHNGIALSVGDPFGDASQFPAAIREFDDACSVNDWSPAFIHSTAKQNNLLKAQGYTLQKIGEEAIVDLEHFNANVKNSKYFRHIRNKFSKAGYTTKRVLPPHSAALLTELNTISNDWLKLPGREEREFLMGSFSANYLQQCPILLLQDETGKTQAFMNQVPSFDPEEANFDFLRYKKTAPSNSSDLLLLAYIEYLSAHTSFKRLNLGLCALSGLGASDNERSVIDSALHFAYANGNWVYSFSGLHRFKAKYKPTWSSRYIAYRGGITGFTRVIAALRQATKP